MPATSTGRNVDVGSIVKVMALPPGWQGMPPETRRAFRAILGHRFKVRGVVPEPLLLELDVSRIVDPLDGSSGNTVWIEPGCVA